MFTRMLTTALVLSLTAVACAGPDASEDDARVEIEEILHEGGAFGVRVTAEEALPRCEESMCGRGEIGGCCESARGPICYSCEQALEPEVRPSECEVDADCGDAETSRCAVREGVGTCYNLCGGPDELGCEDDEICVKPVSSLKTKDFGVCRVDLLQEPYDFAKAAIPTPTSSIPKPHEVAGF